MGPPPVKTVKPSRKRHRKRKRRAASSSSSSSDSDSDSGSSRAGPATLKPGIPEPPPAAESSESSSESSSSDSESDGHDTTALASQKATLDGSVTQPPTRRLPSRSPSPQPLPIPSFLPQPVDEAALEREKDLKEKFRKFWMASVVDGFKDDLEEIRKEPGLDTNRLALLIDSLASGGDVFSSTTDGRGVNEMEVVTSA